MRILAALVVMCLTGSVSLAEPHNAKKVAQPSTAKSKSKNKKGGNVLENADVKAAIKAGKFKKVVLNQGKGDAVKAGKTVTVHYTGFLTNGTEFDSSRKRGKPFEFPLGAGRVIKGWDEGVAGMKKGERSVLVIPAEMGYGARGAGGVIPPNAMLVFDVELIDY